MKRPRGKPRKPTKNPKTSYKTIKRAITNFLNRTEKLVRTVTPDARIVINKRGPGSRQKRKPPQVARKPRGRVPKNAGVQPLTNSNISIPMFREIHLSEISDLDCSPENTDDEMYDQLHQPREEIDKLLRLRFELRKIKANGRSTLGVHANGQTQENLNQNLAVLEPYLEPDVLGEYLREGVDLLPWPSQVPSDSLVVRSNK